MKKCIEKGSDKETVDGVVKDKIPTDKTSCKIYNDKCYIPTDNKTPKCFRGKKCSKK